MIFLKPTRTQIICMSVAAFLCIGLSYFLPIWSFVLVAPQYPRGLELLVHLDGVRGDVVEIDIINHYIGMGKLAEAAQLERVLSKYIVAFLALWAMLWPYFALKFSLLRRWGWILFAGFPLGFISVFYVWLYHFGHSLDPHAIMRIAPFTPRLLGEGKIGQFVTTSSPSWGFLLILIAAGISILQKKWVDRVFQSRS